MKETIDSTKLLTVLVAINALIFLLLSVLHFYWALGGTQWYKEVLPTNSSGTNRLTPNVITTYVVAFGLLILALVTTGILGTFDKIIKTRYFSYGVLLISLLFFLRAIGDFKFVGFFKTVKATRFAANDTHFFSPLCLIIASISLLIFVFSKKLP